MRFKSLNDSTTAMSHQSCVRWPNTAPIVRVYAERSRAGMKPFTRTSPEVGVRMPVSIFTVVDLPAPFAPM
jgi:hypothetical protein